MKIIIASVGNVGKAKESLAEKIVERGYANKDQISIRREKMKIIDDRKPEHKQNQVLVVATDTFLSGWGEAAKGKSMAAWSVKPIDADIVKEWVQNRTDMKNVAIRGGDYKPKNAEHFHIYVADINAIKAQLNRA